MIVCWLKQLFEHELEENPTQARWLTLFFMHERLKCEGPGPLAKPINFLDPSRWTAHHVPTTLPDRVTLVGSWLVKVETEAAHFLHIHSPDTWLG